MKCIIAGGRDYSVKNSDWDLVKDIVRHYKITEIVSGGASGADYFGECFAKKYGLELKKFNANWEKYGKKAGPIRNRSMANYTDYAILFPGGNGTESMIKEMKIHNKKIIWDETDE